MRVLEDLEFDRIMLDCFETLPERGKEILFSAMYHMCYREDGDLNDFFHMGFTDYTKCESPIEKILCVAVDVVQFMRREEFDNWLFYWIPQCDVEDNNKTYRVDFMLTLEFFSEDYSNRSSVDIVIECDGYEFHQKTKQQVKHDNEREMRIKLLGYDVLRFSGTQIYENPMKCANDIIDYAITKISR